MSKPRYIIIILILNYVLLLLVSAVVELHVIAEKAKNVQMTIRTAADMTLEQSQILDDYLSYNGRGTYEILMPRADGNGFERVNMFGGLFNKDSSIEANKDDIFNILYNNNDLKMLSMRTDALRTPVKYRNNVTGMYDWYYIPKIAMIGTDLLPPSKATTSVKDSHGNVLPDALSQQILSAYRLTSVEKYSGGEVYYNTPLNFGFTYLNEELLSRLFVNNMDLIMRLKYDSNLNTEEGGNGVLRGSTYADEVTGDLSAYNPINNGIFTFLRGSQQDSTPDVEVFSGVTPLITYKVIDMYDPTNDTLLVHLFGANKGSFSTKAEYLKSLDQDVLNPVTGRPYDKKPIIVAKVTFYADVVVPYFTLIMRELRGALGVDESNYLDIVPTEADGMGNTRRVSYTRYFAVTP